jgi:hypothetical protein
MRVDKNNSAFSIRDLPSAISTRTVSEMSAAPKDRTLSWTKIVERYALFFERPEIRLRFLNKTLAQQHEREKQLQASLRRVSFIRHTRCYQWLLELNLYRLIFTEIEAFLPSLPADLRPQLSTIKAPLSARAFFRLYKLRYLVYGAGVAATAVALFGLYLLVLWSARNVNDYFVRRYGAPSQTDGGPGTVMANPAKYLPGFQPEKVWQVKKEENYEQYSNGARILTDYEIDNHPRQFYLFKRGAVVPVEKKPRREPIGIIYHTSENEMVDFRPDNNDSIQAKTRGLLKYVQEHKSYNYLIDRFGQIYRIVRDDQAAHHAGFSAWADQKYLYVGLNESFIGVCFESSMDQAGRKDEQLTEAQLVSGRALTAVLRSQYNIDDANCVTHGLVSINPELAQIGSHYDGARDFPFEAMNLSDKYRIPPVTVSEYGFTWDPTLIEKLGGLLWPGVAVAETEFNQRAAASRIELKDLRKQMRDLFQMQYDLGKKLRENGQAQTE